MEYGEGMNKAAERVRVVLFISESAVHCAVSRPESSPYRIKRNMTRRSNTHTSTRITWRRASGALFLVWP